MRVLIISSKIFKTKTGFNFSPLSQALVETPSIRQDEIFLAQTFRDGVILAKEKQLNDLDLVIIEVFLPKNKSENETRCGENCATYLRSKYQTNIILIDEGNMLDNVVNNVHYYLKLRHKYVCNTGRPYLDYIPKEYGERINDVSNFKEVVKTIFGLVTT